MFEYLINFEKKYKYAIQAILITFLMILHVAQPSYLSDGAMLLLIFFVLFLGTYIVHVPNLNLKNYIFSLLLPSMMVIGALLSLEFFPNLGFRFKIMLLLGFGFFYYLITLTDNIFLVVHMRKEVIPLYRVSLTWSQIIQIFVAIPLFAGIYKLPIFSFYQAALIGLVGVIFIIYQLWATLYDEDIKTPRINEGLSLVTLVLFILVSTSLMVSFFPTEAFLKSLFSSIVLMFTLSFTQSHLKNNISKKTLVQYLVLIIFFVLLLIFFQP